VVAVSEMGPFVRSRSQRHIFVAIADGQSTVSAVDTRTAIRDASRRADCSR
jgi:hypothetical protein